MSYVVLARKYRSKNFSEMVGQEHVVRALSNALSSQRLHHAYLFTGTRGIGKTTVSRILAKSLNCVGADGNGGITDQPCGVCQACRDIDAGRFVDYTELDAASNRGVEEIQSLLEQAVYKPVIGRFKVFMIDEVHMLTNTAFNAMLKTLEEPPEYLKFVLATTDPQKVPVTVLSRCLQFNLRPMAPETITDHLGHVLGQEVIGFDQAALEIIGRSARGSMRDALSLTDQAIAFGGGQVREALVREMLGSVGQQHVLALIDALSRADGKAVFEGVAELRASGLNPSATLEDMAHALSRMQTVQLAGQGDAASEPQLVELAQRMPADEVALLYSLCLSGRSELALAPDEYSGLTMVLLRLLAFKPRGTLALAATPAVGGAAIPEKKPDLAPAPPAAPVAVAAAPVVLAPPPVVAPAQPVAAQTPAAYAAVAAPVSQVEHAPEEPADLYEDAGLPPVAPHQEFQEENTALPSTNRASVAINSVATVVSAPALEKTELGDRWEALVRQLCQNEQFGGMPRELALQAQLVAVTDSAYELLVQQKSLAEGNWAARLEATLREAGDTHGVHVRHGDVTDSPAKRSTERDQARQRQAEHIIMSDAYVQDLMARFGATIAPGSITPILAS